MPRTRTLTKCVVVHFTSEQAKQLDSEVGIARRLLHGMNVSRCDIVRLFTLAHLERVRKLRGRRSSQKVR